MKYKQKLISFIDWFSQHMLRIVIILLIAIVVIQALLQIEVIRVIIVPTERWEGLPIQPVAFATADRL